jgi:hypothetical protein
MTQNQLSIELSMVGEAISHQLGAEMVKNFQQRFPTDVKTYYIGRNIIESILAQPGCVGIRFYNALNEMGQKTLVYVGIDANEEVIFQYTTVNQLGELATEKAIVADRVRTGDDGPITPSTDVDNWNWFE